MKKRTLALLTALSLLLAGFSGCAGGETAESNDTEHPAAEAAETSAEAPEEQLDSLEARQLVEDGLSDKQWDGAEFRMICQNRYSEYQFVEELTGDTLNDSVYNRNMSVEDRLNVTLVFDTGSEEEQASNITKTVLAGNDEYDLFLGHSIYTGKYAVQGIFRNWYDLGVDFSKPWFPQYAVKNLTVNGKMFLTVSDICLSLASNTYCYFFDKDLVRDYAMDDPYSVVREGNWTIDYVLGTVSEVFTDVNGDGKADDGDLYGFASEKSNSTVAYLYAFGIHTIEMDENGDVTVVLGTTDKSVDAVEKLRTLLYGKQGTYVGADTSSGVIQKLFAEKKAIFVSGVVSDSVAAYRDSCDFDYGIIPYPKYEAAQDGYYTVAGGSISCNAVPLTASRDELIMTCYTALAAETWKHVIPQYYDVVLKFKGARDQESIDMIDTILDGRSIDFEFIYDAFNGFVYKTGAILSGNTALPTYVAQNGKVVGKHFEKVRDLFWNEDNT